jgi:hypothetical protein
MSSLVDCCSQLGSRKYCSDVTVESRIGHIRGRQHKKRFGVLLLMVDFAALCACDVGSSGMWCVGGGAV